MCEQGHTEVPEPGSPGLAGKGLGRSLSPPRLGRSRPRPPSPDRSPQGRPGHATARPAPALSSGARRRIPCSGSILPPRPAAGEGRARRRLRFGSGRGCRSALLLPLRSAPLGSALSAAAAMSADPVVFVSAARTAVGEGRWRARRGRGRSRRGRAGVRVLSALPLCPPARLLQRRAVVAARARAGRRRHPGGAAPGRAGPRGGVGGDPGAGPHRRYGLAAGPPLRGYPIATARASPSRASSLATGNTVP